MKTDDVKTDSIVKVECGKETNNLDKLVTYYNDILKLAQMQIKRHIELRKMNTMPLSNPNDPIN